jgi:hypothetical protein
MRVESWQQRAKPRPVRASTACAQSCDPLSTFVGAEFIRSAAIFNSSVQGHIFVRVQTGFAGTGIPPFS